MTFSNYRYRFEDEELNGGQEDAGASDILKIVKDR